MKIIIASDFNISAEDGGVRGIPFDDLLSQVDGRPPDHHGDAWSHMSASLSRRRIGFILFSREFPFREGWAPSDVDLGSEHRTVSTQFYLKYRLRYNRRRRKSFKGWQPLLDQDDVATSYHHHLYKLISKIYFATLSNLSSY